MKVGLIHSPYMYKTDKWSPDYYHAAGIMYIAEALRRGGNDIKLVDFEHNSNASLKEIDDCDVVGINSYLDCYNFFKQILPQLKDKGKMVVVGGPLISSYGLENNLLMRVFPEIDFGVIGEGESTASGLIKFLEKRGELPKGIVHREREILKNTGRGAIISNLDDVPELDYDNQPDLKEKVPGHVFDLLTARGCYNQCSFCFKNFQGVRSFSLSRIEKEIEKISRLNPRMLCISDDVFGYDKEKAMDIAKLCQKNGLPYHVTARVNDIDSRLGKVLKETGCRQVSYGIESLDREIIRRINKNVTLEQVYNAIEITHASGMRVKGYFIVGLPGETRKSIETTIREIEKTKVIPRVRLLIPLPGTLIYAKAVKEGKIDEVKLLKQLSEPEHYDSINGDWVPVNMSDGLSDEELIQARDRISELGKIYEK